MAASVRDFPRMLGVASLDVDTGTIRYTSKRVGIYWCTI